MGMMDVTLNDYLADPIRFANVANNKLFHGEQIIDPQKLKIMDGAETTSGMQKKKTRDIIKMLYDNQCVLAMIGIENQINIHYAMPLRSLVYDVNTYEKQRRMIQKQHEKVKDIQGDEWISRFAKTDKLIPVVTLVIYYGSDEWDGPMTLLDMLEIPPSMEPYESLLLNYEMNLLEISKIQDFDDYCDDLKIVFGFIKYQKDKKKLQDYIKTNEKLFRSVTTENCQVIQAVTKSEKLIQYVKKEEEKEEYDMCQALVDMERDAELRGKIEGKLEGRLEGKIEGKLEGEHQAKLQLVKKKLAKGRTIEQIADALEENSKYVKLLIEELERNDGII